MTEGRHPGTYAVDAVGLLLSISGLGYLLSNQDSVLVGLAEITFPILLGVLVVGYGWWLRRTGLSPTQIETIALGNGLGGAAFAFFTGWLLYVASLEVAIPGETTFILLNGIAIGIVAGGFLGTLYVSLQERQTELRQRNRELRRQNERLDQFASIVSHDLRNPLNVAKGRVELAKETDAEPSHLDALERALDRIEAILTDMLAFARQGKTVESVEPLELESVARAAWEAVKTEDVELVVEGTRVVFAHESRLSQGLENLFRNALEHGGPDVSTVWVGPIEETGFYVEDDGDGIPEQDLEKVFESGFSTTEAGTGFGLPIVKAVVEAHGWTIDVTEGRAGGARFEVGGLETR